MLPAPSFIFEGPAALRTVAFRFEKSTSAFTAERKCQMLWDACCLEGVGQQTAGLPL